jgi:hypothetical protein
MPIGWTVTAEDRFAVLSIVEPYTMAEWHDATARLLDAPIARPSLRLLIDRRQLTPFTLSFVAEMTGYFVAYSAAFAQGVIAIVVSNDAGLELGRMTAARSSVRLPTTKLQTFRSYDDAVSWLIGGA